MSCIARVLDKHKEKPEFCQALQEVGESLQPLFDKYPVYEPLFELIATPERVIMFRVPWVDEKGESHVNMGYRVQFSSALGPYKGGLRFHPSVNLSILMFLGFEQIFKNALTGESIGGGKGGSDFDPKHRSDRDIAAFCQSFMTELHRHIGPHIDVPAGDIGCGGREIGYLFGQYKRLQNSFDAGVLTGKSLSWGGSLLRPEATGYGCVYFSEHMLAERNQTLSSQRCLVSGSGNVAQYAAEKLIEKGAIVLTLSDSSGTIIEPNGFTSTQLKALASIKSDASRRVSEYISSKEASSNARFEKETRPWMCGLNATLAYPCATQNEIDTQDAFELIQNGLVGVFEGSNMGSTNSAIRMFHEHHILYGLGKCANAGGVAVSSIEMTQNETRKPWSRDAVDEKLQQIMAEIYRQGKVVAEEYHTTFDKGANIAGFLRVAKAVKEQGGI